MCALCDHRFASWEWRDILLCSSCAARTTLAAARLEYDLGFPVSTTPPRFLTRIPS